MPIERRSLRSHKDSNASGSGDKSKEKPTTRSTAANNKKAAAPAKKGSTSSAAKDTSKGKSKANGAEAVKDAAAAAKGSDDVEMGKDGEDEMTVVVPPPNSSKLSAEPEKEDVDDSEHEGSEEDGEEQVDPAAKAVADIKANFALLDKAVHQFDARFSLRVLRSISSTRKHLSPEVLAEVITDTYNASSHIAQSLLKALGQQNASFTKDVDMDADARPAPAKALPKDILPEVDTYLGILTQVYFWDAKVYDKGAEFSAALVDRLRNMNRRTLDSLAAKVYFYYSLFFEQLAPLPPSASSPVISIRPQLLAALRTAVLRKDQDTQAAVYTLLLRNYLSTSHIKQADLLIQHSQFNEAASNNHLARYFYYLGRIRAIQLSYTEAHEHLISATRKSPSSHSAGGFYQASTKLLIIVELLMGDIPDRATFRQPSLERYLQPYLELVQAVRVGDLEKFVNIVRSNSGQFRRDGTYTLILRLRQNVIKTGIRMMSLSYARISLYDICVRLGLPSEETAEYIVAKAIRDGVIEATLDHENGYMKSKEAGDVYATREPGEAFHDRIRACLSLHDESVKAMRFPMNQHRLELKNAQEARERERELAKEIVDGEMDDDDAGGDFEGMIDPSVRLRRAIHRGDVVLARRIVATMGDDVRAVRNPDFEDQSNTSLHAAARSGSVEIVSLLVDAGHEDERISVNTAGQTPLAVAVEAGQEATAVWLGQRFARCIAWRDRSGQDALMGAARGGFASLVSALLALTDDRPALLAATDADGNTALHVAAAFGQLKCAMLLLHAGAAPHAANHLQWQPVHYSSTVAAEVFFKNAVTELETRRSTERAREQELERRKEAGVRVVHDVDDDDASEDDSPSPPHRPPYASPSNTDPTGRTTPSSVRSQSRGLVNRLRAGSLE